MDTTWKLRFTKEVLPRIDKGYRIVGQFCLTHFSEDCNCYQESFVPCANCYFYGDECGNHFEYLTVSFQGILSHMARPM